MLAWLSILAYRSSGGAKKENLGDKLAKFAPGKQPVLCSPSVLP